MKTYFKLIHGRENPNSDESQELSTNAIGPVMAVQIVFMSHIFLVGLPDFEFLSIVDGFIFYDGVFYSDISVFDEETMRKSNLVAEKYDPKKSRLNEVATKYLEEIKR